MNHLLTLIVFAANMVVTTGNVAALTCPIVGAPWEFTDLVVEVTRSPNLCTLNKLTANGTVLIPVARSYDNNDWYVVETTNRE